MSGIQGSTLSRSRDRGVWEDQRIVVRRGPFKGYHGLVKAQYEGSVIVELDARLASSGLIRQRVPIKDVSLECLFECVMRYLLFFA